MDLEEKNRIIWTEKELEEYAKLPVTLTIPYVEPNPLTWITAQSGEAVSVKEVSEVEGDIAALLIHFPFSPPTFGLVKVKVLLRGQTLIDYITYKGKYSFTSIADIRRGDTLEVLVQNSDESFEHTIGIRVNVKEFESSLSN